MRCFIRQLSIFFAAILALVFLSPALAQAKPNPKYASIVMDAETGMILSHRYADKVLYPASLTKMMTLLLTFEALEKRKIGLYDRVVISRHAASMVPSKLDLPAGETIRVEDAIYALVTKSANDVAVALGEKIAGTESQFAMEMTRRAWAIGMNNTRFRNASGLHDPRQVTTARDMAKLARYILTSYPEYYHYFGTENFTYRGVSYHNHNRLLGKYRGMDGFKTGYIQASGFNLVASARRDGHRLIGVVFGGRSAKTRNAHMVDILDNGFTRMHDIRVASAKIPTPERKPDSLIYMADASVSSARLNRIQPAAGSSMASSPSWAALNPAFQNGAFKTVIGEGDSDPAATDRLETGLIAIAAHKTETQTHPAHYNTASLSTAGTVSTGPWSIQIGAFASQAKAQRALSTALQKLPAPLNQKKTVVVPLKTANGWLFRGRFSGYSKDEALLACRYIHDCLPVSPRAF